VVFRPSGTEPKMKVYLELIERAVDGGAAGYEAGRARAAGALTALRGELARLLELPINP
jgi:phosphomannomutase